MAARELIGRQVGVIESQWGGVCDLAEFGVVERKRLWGQAVFNPYCFEGWE